MVEIFDSLWLSILLDALSGFSLYLCSVKANRVFATLKTSFFFVFIFFICDFFVVFVLGMLFVCGFLSCWFVVFFFLCGFVCSVFVFFYLF